MFNNLYKLYRNASTKTPLEDFNTECFAGLLNHYPEILAALVSFLKLPEDSYNVETQNYFPLSADPNCFVDLILTSDNCICFIEVKVNSSEGYKQLQRYEDVLKSINKKEKHLRYITKWSEPKINEFINFSQHRWYEIGYILQENFSENSLVKDYLTFLKTHNMAQQKEITTETVIALKNFYQAYSTAMLHFENGIEAMKISFPLCTTDDYRKEHQQAYKQVVEGARIAHYIPHLFFNDQNHNSEILVSLNIGSVCYQVQVWLNINHQYADILMNKAKEQGDFDVVLKDENGLMINCNKTLYQFIEVEKSDLAIKEWFKLSLSKIKMLIESLPELDWEDKLLSND